MVTARDFRPGLRVVLVEPRHEGNVGSVARVMKNFGFSRLCLVNPCPLGGQARAMALHARDILQGARRHRTLEAALRGAPLAVGATAKGSPGDGFLRGPRMTPRELAAHLKKRRPRETALVLGREDFGLRTEEMARMDLIVTIPTTRAYPSLNLSHAAAILLHELSAVPWEPRSPPAAPQSLQAYLDDWEQTMADIGYFPHRRQRARIMLRRLLARAGPTRLELSMLRGQLRQTRNAAQRGRR
ncbi:MAG: RNA methyltransferase [Euryarchaeota archaeon]|nr:RNA methyltransferase [Euryarchaeota archaeon]